MKNKRGDKPDIVKSKRGGRPGNTNAIGNKGGAAPTKYKVEYDQQVYNLAMLGISEKDMAKFFEVSLSTFSLWKITHSSFSDTLREGKIIADGKVAVSLYRRAIGYQYTETHFEKIDGKVNLEITPDKLITTDTYKKKIIVKELPPDVGAAVMWLKNRHKEIWRDKHNIEIDYEKLSDEQLDYMIDQIQKKGKEDRS